MIKNTLLSVLLCTTAGEALAGAGTIVFGAVNANPVPGMSGPILLILGFLLAFVAFKLKHSGNHTAFLVAALSAATVLFTMGGMKVIKDVQAGLGVAIVANTRMNIHPSNPNVYVNAGSSSISVLGISLVQDCQPPVAVSIAGAGPLCAVGMSVEPDANCSLQCPYETDLIR